MTQTTFDLSTLSDIAEGAHTVKVKAKADGYRDSEFSNEVSYTKAPAPTYSGNISSDADGVYINGIWGVKNGSMTQIVDKGYIYAKGKDVSGYTEYDIALGATVQRYTVGSYKNCTYYAHDSYNYRIVPTANNFTFYYHD